jgi:hypothetical protein
MKLLTKNLKKSSIAVLLIVVLLAISGAAELCHNHKPPVIENVKCPVFALWMTLMAAQPRLALQAIHQLQVIFFISYKTLPHSQLAYRHSPPRAPPFSLL